MSDKTLTSRLVISTNPHIKSKTKSGNIMLDVIIALIPVILASTLIYGPRVLINVVVAGVMAVLTEYVARQMMERPQTIGDLSALVTGIILALNMPAEIPLWQLSLGSIFAIALVKQAFGGIGQNIVNPAMITRLALVSAFSSSFTRPSKPLTWYSDLFGGSITVSSASVSAIADGTSSATYLSVLKGGLEQGEDFPSMLNIIMGNHDSLAVGEVFSLAIILGFIYLLVKKVINGYIPITFIGTLALCSLFFSNFSVNYMLYSIFAGGALFAAVFMATDYATSPLTNRGKIIFGIGCGLITSMIRFWGALPEGASYSIIIMNLLTPHIDRWTLATPLDRSKKDKEVKA